MTSELHFWTDNDKHVYVGTMNGHIRDVELIEQDECHLGVMRQELIDQGKPADDLVIGTIGNESTLRSLKDGKILSYFRGD